MLRRRVFRPPLSRGGVGVGFLPPSPNTSTAFAAASTLAFDISQHEFLRGKPRGASGSTTASSSPGGEAGGGSSSQSGNRTTAATTTGAPDWMQRAHAEIMASEYDPLHGRYHKDYVRDPALGYAPRFAPRNYENGGAVEYHHPLSSLHYSENRLDRDLSDHEFERRRHDARVVRSAARDAAHGAEVVSRRARLGAPAGHEDQGAGDDESRATFPSVTQTFRSEISRGSARQTAGGLGGRGSSDRGAWFDTSSSSPSSAAAATTPLHAGLEAIDISTNLLRQSSARFDNALDGHLVELHGLREKERAEFDVRQRTERLPFRGYDMDRFLASQQGGSAVSSQNPFANTPLVNPATTAEAQRNVRSNSVPHRESTIAAHFQQNTLREDPKLGEALAAELSESLRASDAVRDAEEERKRRERFGLGRQGPLVQDGGPDKRTLKRHVHDERLVKAAIFQSNAYRLSEKDEHIDPVLRNDVSRGVGHLLRTKFDMDRRQRNFSERKPDPTERATQHYGKPVQQELDEFVFRRRNARSERMLEYFRPYPSFRHLRLQRVYRDVEGFQLLRGGRNGDVFEWDLFERYRAHMEQRRDLALRHGLEPKKNETAQERDARRLKLDELCESTPFDEQHYLSGRTSSAGGGGNRSRPTAHTLRGWFGWYFLPSPTMVRVTLSSMDGMVACDARPLVDEGNVVDEREHVLSRRYFNKLFQSDTYRRRLGKAFLDQVVGRQSAIPEPVVPHMQPREVLQHFSAEERHVHDTYVRKQVAKHEAEWAQHKQDRRWLASRESYVSVESGAAAVPPPVDVCDVQNLVDGTVLTLVESEHADAIEAALADPSRIVSLDAKDTTTSSSQYRLLEHSRRKESIVTVRVSADGSTMRLPLSDYSLLPAERSVASPNALLHPGQPAYGYNRNNYIETQDAIWEENTAAGTEGWSPITHADGLRPGLVVSRLHGTSGALQRGVVVQYVKQPFFNPNPRTVYVAFAGDDGTAVGGDKAPVHEVPLSDLLVWQRQYYGPERSVGETTSWMDISARRYVDVSDPNLEKVTPPGPDGEPHFLEKYVAHSITASSDHSRPNATDSIKQITELDGWTSHDRTRSENYRPLSINHRKDYVRLGYLTRYTPWDWIAIQEANAPIIDSQLRSDNVGPAYYHTFNRYWRYKARPFGYVRNFENEVRDLFQYIDGVTPWDKARKIRTYWEVREHHPIPQFNRPEVAHHRNHPSLLPSHMWETDKKTGRVKHMKDSVRDYQTKNPVPSWSAL